MRFNGHIFLPIGLLSVCPDWSSAASFVHNGDVKHERLASTPHCMCCVFAWPVAALASLGYEKTCVLFNAAALASQIAAEQNLDNDEGLKAAAKYYQVGKQPCGTATYRAPG